MTRTPPIDDYDLMEFLQDGPSILAQMDPNKYSKITYENWRVKVSYYYEENVPYISISPQERLLKSGKEMLYKYPAEKFTGRILLAFVMEEMHNKVDLEKSSTRYHELYERKKNRAL